MCLLILGCFSAQCANHILFTCEIFPSYFHGLLTLSACQISMYAETSGNVRKAGGNFKEKFREHGGLDAVFDVTRQCHLNMKVQACHDLNCVI